MLGKNYNLMSKFPLRSDVTITAVGYDLNLIKYKARLYKPM